MRFKPEVAALGLEVYPDNKVDKVTVLTAVSPISVFFLRSCRKDSFLLSRLPPITIPKIVTFVANFHKLAEMGFSPERIKQALLLHEDVQNAIAYVAQ
jgi:hypothetical protein